MYGSHSTVAVCNSNPHCHYINAHFYQYVRQLQYSFCMPYQSSLSQYQFTLLPICTVATVLLLQVIANLTVSVSVPNFTYMYGSHSTVTVCHSNPHFHYIIAHCYQYVRQPQLLQPCASIAVQLLYAIPNLTPNRLVCNFTNMQGCHSTVTLFHSKAHCRYISAQFYQYVRQPQLLQPCVCIAVQLLYAIPILTLTMSLHTVSNMYGIHCKVTVCHSNSHYHYIGLQCYQYIRQPQQSYCIPFQCSLSVYQCTILPICAVATELFLYADRILNITILEHNFTNMYFSQSCFSHVTLLQYNFCMPFESSLSLYPCTLLPVCTVATVLYSIRIQSSPSLYHCTLLQICTVATVQLLYSIPVLTVSLSVHTATNMYGSHSTVTVFHTSSHCQFISAHCYQYVRQPRYSYCIPHQFSLSVYQCTLLPIYMVVKVQLLYSFPFVPVTIQVQNFTSMYGSHIRVLYAIPILTALYQCTFLAICTVATVNLLYDIPILNVAISLHTVNNMYGSHSTVGVCHSKPQCRYIIAYC